MSDTHDNDHGHDVHGHFSVDLVFGLLFGFTIAEVAWGYAGHGFHWNRPILWGGLLFFAALKGWLIAVYFMHLKFEGWVVKSLILPTPFLLMVIFGYVVPDVANKTGNLIHPIGAMMHPETGDVLDDISDEAWGTTHGDGAEH